MFFPLLLVCLLLQSFRWEPRMVNGKYWFLPYSKQKRNKRERHALSIQTPAFNENYFLQTVPTIKEEAQVLPFTSPAQAEHLANTMWSFFRQFSSCLFRFLTLEMRAHRRWGICNVRRKKERVPCKCIVQGVLPGSSLTLQLLHVMPYSPGKFLRAFFGQEHHCTAWSPSEVISLQPVFSSCCYFFLSQVLIPWSTSDVVLGTVSNVLALICPKQNASPVCAKKMFALFSINLPLSKGSGWESMSYSIVATVP